MLSADTNLFLYAANPDSPNNQAATEFFAACAEGTREFATCELVLVEIYMQLRNPAIMRNPLAGHDAALFCKRLRSNPRWQHIDYEPVVSKGLWQWAQSSTAGFRRIIDARLALTLKHHGVKEFATANVKDFEEFGFDRVWNPVTS